MVEMGAFEPTAYLYKYRETDKYLFTSD